MQTKTKTGKDEPSKTEEQANAETVTVEKSPTSFDDFHQSMINLGKVFADSLIDRSRFMNEAELKEVEVLCKLHDSLKPTPIK